MKLFFIAQSSELRSVLNNSCPGCCLNPIWGQPLNADLIYAFLSILSVITSKITPAIYLDFKDCWCIRIYMNHLKNEEKDYIFMTLNLFQTLSTTVAQVFQCPPRLNQWHKLCAAVVCFVKDNSRKSYFIKAVNFIVSVFFS